MSQTYEYGDYNRGGMIAFTFSMVVTLVFFVYVAFVHSGVDLKEMEPEASKVEKIKNIDAEMNQEASDSEPTADAEKAAQGESAQENPQ